MNSVERVKAICKERHIPIYKLEKDCGFANGYIGQLRKGTFPSDRLYIIAEYLGVSPEYLNSEKENAPDELSSAEWELIDLFRKADDYDKQTIRHILNRYKQDTSFKVG